MISGGPEGLRFVPIGVRKKKESAMLVKGFEIYANGTVKPRTMIVNMGPGESADVEECYDARFGVRPRSSKKREKQPRNPLPRKR